MNFSDKQWGWLSNMLGEKTQIPKDYIHTAWNTSYKV